MTAYNRNTLLVGIAVIVLVGGVVSYFASSNPDGLEKVQEDIGADQPPHAGMAAPPSPFTEYGLAQLGEGFWSNAVAGVAGSLLVLGILLGAGHLLRRRPKTSGQGGPAAADS